MDIMMQQAGKTLNVVLSGKFTFTDNPEFRAVLDKIAEPDMQEMILHMDKVEFVDSAALGMLLLANEEVAKHRKNLCIRGANGQVRRIFDLAKFGQYFNLQ